MRLKIIILPPLPLISMICLPFLPQTKLACQSSNLLLSYSSLPHSSFVSAVVAVVVLVVVVVGVGDSRAYKGAWGLELLLGLKRLERHRRQGKQLDVV